MRPKGTALIGLAPCGAWGAIVGALLFSDDNARTACWRETGWPTSCGGVDSHGDT